MTWDTFSCLYVSTNLETNFYFANTIILLLIEYAVLPEKHYLPPHLDVDAPNAAAFHQSSVLLSVLWKNRQWSASLIPKTMEVFPLYMCFRKRPCEIPVRYAARSQVHSCSSRLSLRYTLPDHIDDCHTFNNIEQLVSNSLMVRFVFSVTWKHRRNKCLLYNFSKLEITCWFTVCKIDVVSREGYTPFMMFQQSNISPSGLWGLVRVLSRMWKALRRRLFTQVTFSQILWRQGWPSRWRIAWWHKI